MAAVAANNCCFQVSSAKPKVYSVPILDEPPKPSLSLRSHAVRISETFSCLRSQGKVAFIPYITAGDPDLSTTEKALKLLNYRGADIIELGLPFSNPRLDGHVIQVLISSQVPIFPLQVIPQISSPIVIFAYYNLILQHDVEWFFSALEDAGAKGLMVPDLPFEESATLKKVPAKKNIDLVVLLSTPSAAKEQLKAIADASEGFIYLASSSGVTGARATVNTQVEFLLKDIKEETAKPVAVGFGISKPEHIKQISSWGADGVVVGSAIVELLGKAKFAEEGWNDVESFVASLRAALPICGKN
ncbi:tryptophan synthase alpha chain-like isoform X1 [Canna indica]|uniref:tryptophan synthase n=1 Tax=Canna indica TaxID=4628 RepID=A0AAQ3PZI9_9LILI|nr:tryptophan synthase alpha chain-like isoform X1 [Canna indica]